MVSIDVYTVCRNEIKIVPFFIDYWRTLSDDVKVHVYDGFSWDGTRDLLSKYDWIEIIDSEKTSHGLNNIENIRIKNSCWKGSSADFVMVCDFDETIFSYDVDTLRDELQYMKDNGYTILAPLSFNLISDDLPKYQEGKLLHEIVKTGFNDSVWESKPILFSPKEITDINYVLGAHSANPKGNVKWYQSDSLFLIHANFLGVKYRVDKSIARLVRDKNQTQTSLDIEKLTNTIRSRIDGHKAEMFCFSDIKENFDKYYKIRTNWSNWGKKINVDLTRKLT